jgi:carbon-monoxide dehydrogenase medium subunit
LATALRRGARERALKPAEFAYIRAGSLDAAFDALQSAGGEAKLLAGGQSLMPALNMRLSEPRLLIDINAIPGLDAIVPLDGGLRIGALARQAALGRSPEVARLAPLIRQAIPHIAHPAIRNRGTLGGSLAQADPAAELPACAVALGASLHLASRRGTRIVAAADFFRGLYETALAPDEILTAIDTPAPAPGTRSAFLEFARRRGDYAIAGIAATARVDRGAAAALRLVFFGIDDKPVEAREATAALLGGNLSERLTAAEEALAGDIDPSGDLQANAATKAHLARVLLRRAVTALAAAPHAEAA